MYIRPWGLVSCVLVVCAACMASGGNSGWKKEAADLRLPAGQQIKAIYYPADKPVRMMKDGKPLRHDRKYLYPLRKQNAAAATSAGPVLFDLIDSPPLDGFVPWLAVTATNAHSDELDWVAYPQGAVIGSALTSTPESDYAIGIFDTGASATMMGYQDAIDIGIYSHSLVSSSTIGLIGATGTVDAMVSYPLGVFAGGLNAIGTDGTITDVRGLAGESNVSIIVGKMPLGSAPDLPTAIGAPMWVYYSASFDNENKVTRVHDANEFTCPSITIFDPCDAGIPAWDDISIPLELRPVSATGVSYIATMDIDTFEYLPQSPSIISDGASQSLFFVSSVDLANAGHAALDRNKFMFDTGAQVTVVGSSVAARLALDPKHPQFQVEIQDATGENTLKPGFYIDSLEIPALGQWLSATHVPVVYMDVRSPEGGFLDGIIGMNLFTEYNLVFRGGAFDDPPFLDMKLITNPADIAPAGGDGYVNWSDVQAVCDAWLAGSGDATWNAAADLWPAEGDGVVNFADFAVVAANWGWVRGQ